MKGYYYLLIWYVLVSIGISQNVIDGIDTPNTALGYLLLLGLPTGIYLLIRMKNKPKQQILK